MEKKNSSEKHNPFHLQTWLHIYSKHLNQCSLFLENSSEIAWRSPGYTTIGL